MVVGVMRMVSIGRVLLVALSEVQLALAEGFRNQDPWVEW